MASGAAAAAFHVDYLADNVFDDVLLEPYLQEPSTSSVITALYTLGPTVWVGSIHGHIRVLKVRPSLGTSQCLDAYDVLQQTEVRPGSPIDALHYIDALQVLCVLSKQNLTFHRVDSQGVLTTPAMPAIREVRDFSVSTGPPDSKILPGSPTVGLCVLRTTNILSVKVTRGNWQIEEDLRLPESNRMQVCEYRNTIACIADAETYYLVDFAQKGMAVVTDVARELIDTRAAPLIVALDRDEFLVATHIAETTLGIIVNAEGTPIRGTFVFPQRVASWSVAGPVLTVLYVNGESALFSLNTQQPINLLVPLSQEYAQHARYISGTPSSWIIRPPLTDASFWLGEWEKSNLIPLDPTPVTLLTYTLVVGHNQIFSITPYTASARAAYLLETRGSSALQDVTSILETAQLTPDDRFSLLVDCAYKSLQVVDFQSAFNFFLKSACSPIIVLLLFPDLLDGVEYSEETFLVPRRIEPTRSASSYIDSFLTNDDKLDTSMSYALMTAARDAVRLYLSRWRSMSRADVSETVLTCVDTAYARLLAEEHLFGELQDFFSSTKRPPMVDMRLVQSQFLSAGYTDLLAEQARKSGFFSLALDVWAKVVEGEYESDLSERDALAQMDSILQACDDRSVVLRYGGVLLKHDSQRALEMFVNAHKTLFPNYEDLITEIGKQDAHTANLFLERIALSQPTRDPSLYAKLLDLLLENLKQFFSSHRSYSPGLINQYASREGSLSSSFDLGSSFLSYLVADALTNEEKDAQGSGEKGGSGSLLLVLRPESGREQSDFSRGIATRIKFLLVLNALSVDEYDFESLRKTLNKFEMSGVRGLDYERALTAFKLGQDSVGLSLLLNMRDYATCLAYVQGTFFSDDSIVASAHAVNLQNAPRLPESQEKTDPERYDRVARLCVSMSLDRIAPDLSSLFIREMCSLWVGCVSDETLLTVLEAIPKTWSLGDVGVFLTHACRLSTASLADSRMHKALAQRDNFSSELQFYDKLNEYKPVVQTEESVGHRTNFEKKVKDDVKENEK